MLGPHGEIPGSISRPGEVYIWLHLFLSRVWLKFVVIYVCVHGTRDSGFPSFEDMRVRQTYRELEYIAWTPFVHIYIEK